MHGVAPQPLTSVSANASGGTLAAGTYNYEITAATAYGESEPSVAKTVPVGANGSATLTWPEATNGTGAAGNAGPTLAQLESSSAAAVVSGATTSTAKNPGSTTYGLVGQVAENPAATTATTYSFTDTGATPGAAPGSGSTFPSATDPGIDCSSAAGSWLPATSTSPDSSIEQEIGLDQAFAKANGLTNFNPAALVPGEHSGLENPNMPAALAGAGITVSASDGSRQPNSYAVGAAVTAPRFPSNIYYNASNWTDQLSEYNTLLVKPGVSIGDPTYPSEVGRCENTNTTTCLSAPVTEAGFLAAESHTMLSHILNNDPRVGYAHQTNLIGPATQNGADYGYTLLNLLNDMLSQYQSWYNTNAPLDQMTDAAERRTLASSGLGGRRGGRTRSARPRPMVS